MASASVFLRPFHLAATALFAGVVLAGMLSAQEQAQPPNPTPSTTSAVSSETPAAPGPSSGAKSPSIMTLSPGMLIRVKLEKTIDARRADVGEQVVAKTIEDLKSNPAKLASKGCQVIGHIVEVTPHQGNSASTLKIVFDKVILKNGSDVALPATIQAVGYPDQFVPTDYSAMTNVMGGTGTMPEIGTGGQAMVAGGDPAQYEGGRMPSIRSNPDLQLPLTARV